MIISFHVLYYLKVLSSYWKKQLFKLLTYEYLPLTVNCNFLCRCTFQFHIGWVCSIFSKTKAKVFYSLMNFVFGKSYYKLEMQIKKIKK